MTPNLEPVGVLIKAVAFAAEKHRTQRRKDADASPYINHPIALAEEFQVSGQAALGSRIPRAAQGRGVGMGRGIPGPKPDGLVASGDESFRGSRAEPGWRQDE